MDLQIKPADVLIIKGDIQIMNQKSYLKAALSWIYKRDVLIKLFLRGDKEKLISNHLVGLYLMGLNIKKSKQKEFKMDLFD